MSPYETSRKAIGRSPKKRSTKTSAPNIQKTSELLKRLVNQLLRSTLGTSLTGLRVMHAYHSVRALSMSRFSDEEFAQRSHRRSCGTPLDLRQPTTFDERIWWLKLHYRDPLITTCTDKIAVRDYVRNCGLSHILLPLLAIYSTPQEIEWSLLPDQFYIKTNNSSATNIRCDDLSAFDTKHATKRLRLYMKRNHYALSREWNYKEITPRLIIEPVIDNGNDSLVDYRFFCSYGNCHGIFVDIDTADSTGRHRADARRNVYDRDWNLLDVQVTRPRILDKDIPRPKRLLDMIRYAEELSQPFPSCRVDFYYLNDERIIFGELTFFHGGGNNKISPRSYEKILGSWITIPDQHDAPH